MKKKIKIIHIAQSDGGVEIYLRMFLKYYDSNKYDVYMILSQQYEKSKEEFEKLGINVNIVEMYRDINIKNDLKAMWEIFKCIKKIKPDIVYTHSSKAGALGRIPAKILNVYNCYNPHGWAFDMNISNKKKFIYINIEKILAKITDKVIAISHHELDTALEKKICKKEKILLIENGIDIQFHQQKTCQLRKEDIGLSDNDILIGMVGRISEQKSPKTFVEIAKELNKDRNNLKFILVGDGDQKEEIVDFINKNNLNTTIQITGWVTNVYEYINLFDIALLTSKWEGFGLVLPEYMVNKVPIVAADVGGIPSVITHNKTGVLVSKENVMQFCTAIKYLLDDVEFKEHLIENAYIESINRFDFKRVVSQHEELFGKIIK